MFGKYKKPGTAEVMPKAHDAVQDVPATANAGALASLRKPQIVAETPRPAAKAAEEEKDVKRRQRLDEIKTEMHSRLLDNLNLAALESAKEADLRAEITSIVSEQLAELGVVLNREDRQTLNVELFDEVTGLGPLEPLLKDPDVNDILVNGPNRVFV